MTPILIGEIFTQIEVTQRIITTENALRAKNKQTEETLCELMKPQCGDRKGDNQWEINIETHR